MSNTLLEMTTNRSTSIDNLERDFKWQQKYKALHCKYPVIEMGANRFSQNRNNGCSRMSPSRK